MVRPRFRGPSPIKLLPWSALIGAVASARSVTPRVTLSAARLLAAPLLALSLCWTGRYSSSTPMGAGELAGDKLRSAPDRSETLGASVKCLDCGCRIGAPGDGSLRVQRLLLLPPCRWPTDDGRAKASHAARGPDPHWAGGRPSVWLQASLWLRWRPHPTRLALANPRWTQYLSRQVGKKDDKAASMSYAE